MPIPDRERRRLDAACAQLLGRLPRPRDARREYGYRVRDHVVELFARDGDAEAAEVPFARLRYTPNDGRWTLQASDGQGKWSALQGFASRARVEDLLAEIERDPQGLFLG